MKRLMLFAAVLLGAVLLAGCCGPGGCGPRGCGSRGCGPQACAMVMPSPVVHHTHPHYAGRVSVPHPLPQRSLFTETQIPMVDCQGQCRLMGESKFRNWVCEPAKPMQPLP